MAESHTAWATRYYGRLAEGRCPRCRRPRQIAYRLCFTCRLRAAAQTARRRVARASPSTPTGESSEG